jgi:hypothetical protein
VSSFSPFLEMSRTVYSAHYQRPFGRVIERDYLLKRKGYTKKPETRQERKRIRHELPVAPLSDKKVNRLKAKIEKQIRFRKEELSIWNRNDLVARVVELERSRISGDVPDEVRIILFSLKCFMEQVKEGIALHKTPASKVANRQRIETLSWVSDCLESEFRLYVQQVSF